MAQRSTIDRYECKYLIDETTAHAIARHISPICHLDENDQGRGGYLIHSLYFDTPKLDFFAANERNMQVRFKPRVRTYAGADHCPHVWLELKCKYGIKCQKSRVRIDAADWPHVLAGPRAQLPRELVEHDSFLHVVDRYGAVPMAHIRYRREAWASEIDRYVRITFDRELTVIAAEGSPVLREHDASFIAGATPIDDGAPFGASASPVVLEIKCETRVPQWLLSVIRRFELRQCGVSKYLLGMRALTTWESRASTSRIYARASAPAHADPATTVW